MPDVPGEQIIFFTLRLLHISSGVGWLGEVLAVNFVLVPVLVAAPPSDRTRLLQTVFPLVFRLATVLGGLAVLSGLGLVLWMTQLELDRLLVGAWGWRILVAGSLGALLYGFHLFQESGAERTLAARLAALVDDSSEADALLRRLAIFPRVGLAILLAVVVLMSAAVRLP